MPHPRGKRNPYVEATSYILQVGLNDKILKETVFNQDPDKVFDYIVTLYTPKNVEEYELLRRACPEVLRGEVLLDSRGRGSFQT